MPQTLQHVGRTDPPVDRFISVPCVGLLQGIRHNSPADHYGTQSFWNLFRTLRGGSGFYFIFRPSYTLLSGPEPRGMGTKTCDVYMFSDPVFVCRDVFSDPVFDQCVAQSALNIRHESVDLSAVRTSFDII